VGDVRSPLLSLPGAVEADPPDLGVAAHYGDPMREQRRLDNGDGFVDQSHHGVVRIAGPDRLAWLHSLISQHVERLAPGDSAEGLLLSPQGHVEHHFGIVDDGSCTWLTVEPGAAPDLVAFLDSMRFLMRVEIADVTGDWAVVWEPRAGQHVRYLTRERRFGLGGRDLLVPRSELMDYVTAAALGDPAGTWPFEALRIAAHEPRHGLESDHRTIPHEIGWIGTAVNLDKGCYRGQETVARVHNLGRPPRRMVFLHLDGSVERLPAHGTPVEYDGRQVGTVTSAARHYELGPIALAVVKRNTPTDVPFIADGVAASQEVVVPPDVGLHIRADLRT
jgi:tRNA-modifying protein YgfZ